MRALRRIAVLGVMLVFWLVLCPVCFAQECASWSLDANGTLTLSGSGASHLSDESVPWAQYRRTIKRVVVESGVTTIEEGAFESCTALESVSMKSSVTRVGAYAFYGCRSLTSVGISSSCTNIGSHAFGYCSKLESVVVPRSVLSVGSNVFGQCSALTHITAPAWVVLRNTEEHSLGLEDQDNLEVAYNGCISIADGTMFTSNCENGLQFTVGKAVDFRLRGFPSTLFVKAGDVSKSEVTSGTLAIDSDFYTVSYLDSNGNSLSEVTEAGTYTAVLTGKGPFAGSSKKIEGVLFIKNKFVGTPYLLGKVSYTYEDNGYFNVVYSGKRTRLRMKGLVLGRDYSVKYLTYPQRKTMSNAPMKAGRYVVFVAGKGDYAGVNYELQIWIHPSAPKITKVVKLKSGSYRIRWSGSKGGATQYIISISDSYGHTRKVYVGSARRTAVLTKPNKNKKYTISIQSVFAKRYHLTEYDVIVRVFSASSASRVLK